MTPPKITVLSKPSCVQCTATKRKLDKLGLEYEAGELYDLANSEIVATAKQLGISSAPIVVVSYDSGPDHMWGGYRPDMLDGLVNL